MRVMISGYYGFGNAGDEAILSGMLAALRRADPAVDVTVLSGSPEHTTRLHGIKAIDRQRYGQIWNALKSETELFISGGGGLLQDRTSRRSPLYYLGLIRMAQQARVPTYLYAQGVGPVETPLVRMAARRLLRGISGAGTRDVQSAERLLALGVPAERVQVSADPAFCLDADDAVEQTDLLESFDIPWGRRPLLGVVWRDPRVSAASDDDDQAMSVTAEAIAQFAQDVEARVVLLPLYPSADTTAVDALAQALTAAGCTWIHRPAGDLDYRTCLRLLCAMDVNLSVRYHGILFSAIGGVPAVALEYDPKVRNLAEQLSLPCLPVGVDAATLFSALKALWAGAGAVTSAMWPTVTQVRARGVVEAQTALQMARTPIARHGEA